MANYSLILDTKFKPFSYAEMLAPVAAATQAHQALEEEYGNLTTKANVWENMANEQTDPYAYKMYKAYSDDLEARAEQLMRYGLNASSRKGMLDMRARYSKEIVPIETAYKRREELAAEQRKAMLSNPTLFYQRDAASMSLDDFIKNPSLDYGAVYSGALLTQQAGQIASNLKTALTKKGDLKSLGLQFQYERLLQYGFTPNQIEKAITNPKEGDPVLTAIVDQVLESSGMAQWASPEQMKRARAFANQGLYNAIGKPEIQTFTDQAGLAKYKADLDDRNNARQFARQQAAKKQEEENTLKQRIALGADSFLNTSGDLSKYQGLVSTLFTKDGKPKASYFGKSLDRNGNARDPLAVYEQYWKAYNDAYKAAAKYNNEVINRKSTPKSTSPAFSIGRGTYDTSTNRLHPIGIAHPTKNPKEEALKAANAVLRQHKVTAVLTKDQYNALKGLKINTHYNSRKNGSMVDFYGTFVNAINRKGTETSLYSTKMSDYSYIDGVISRNLSWRNDNGTYNGLVYSLTADGKKGKATSFKSLGFKDDDTSKHVTDVAYSAIHPDKIIVTIGSSKYLMAPEVLGGEYAGILETAQQALKEGTSKDEVSYNTTVALAGLLNSYNPVRSKSSSEFE